MIENKKALPKNRLPGPESASNFEHYNIVSAPKSQSNLSFVDVAIKAIENQFSVIPTGSDKKCTLPAWKEYQTRLMSETEARKYFANATRIAVIGGKVSGNLECLDFDDPTVYEPFLDLLEMRVPGLAGRLLKRSTPSGGYHIVYRCSEQEAKTMKLAVDAAGQVRIETRGEGSYFLSPPSDGYKVIYGSLLDCPTITPEELKAIHQTAKAFDLREAPGNTKGTTKKDNADSPGSQFNAAHTVEEILTTHGWREDRKTTAGMGWTRPGKDSGTSGVLLNTGNFYVWSSNAAPLEPGRSYDAFGLFTVYNHGGDFTATARELAGAAPKASMVEEWEPTTPEWPVMDARAYRGIAKDFIDLATRDSEADPAAILGTLIVRFGVEVGPETYMNVGDTKHRARTATVVVGASGKSRKGTSGKPVARLFDLVDVDSHTPYFPSRASKGPFSSGEGIIYAIRDAVTKWDSKDQCEVVVDPGIEDKRLFVLDEEFGGVLANTKREGNTLSMIIRQAWDSGNFDPLTKNNKTTATGGHVGWVSHITLQELHAKLNESEGFNGFANRILWVCAKRTKLIPDPQPMPEQELLEIQKRLIRILRQVRGGKVIKMTAAARQAWQDHYYADLTEDRPGLMGCVTNRGEAQSLRLAMIYCLLDGETEISLDHLKAGIAFWDYCRQSAAYIFHGRQTDTTAQTIIEALKKGPLSGTKIHQLFNNHVSKDRLEIALSELIASNQVVFEKQKNQKGAPTKIYRFLNTTCELSELSELKPPVVTDEPIKFSNSLNSQDDSFEMEVFDI